VVEEGGGTGGSVGERAEAEEESEAERGVAEDGGGTGGNVGERAEAEEGGVVGGEIGVDEGERREDEEGGETKNGEAEWGGVCGGAESSDRRANSASLSLDGVLSVVREQCRDDRYTGVW